MIHSIKFKNYKAFATGEIKVKPITILLGANSVGKSSLMQLFLMFQQTAQTDRNYKSALKLHGGFTSMGESLNLIRKKDPENILSFSISLSDKKIASSLAKELKDRFLSEFLQFVELIERFEYLKKEKEKEKLKDKIIQVKDSEPITFSIDDHVRMRFWHHPTSQKGKIWEDTKFEDLLNNISNTLIKNNYEKTIDIKDRFNIYGFELSNYFQIKERKHEFLLLKNYLQKVAELVHDDEFILEWELKAVEKVLEIKSFSIINNNKILIKISFDKVSDSNDNQPNYEVLSDVFDFSIYNKSIKFIRKAIFFKNRPIFNFYNEVEDEGYSNELSIVDLYIKRICIPILKVASANFDTQYINYVSPLRASPKRYYFLDKARSNISLDTLDGDAIAEILKEKSQIKYKVNAWLKKFNLRIEISHLEDIIHKLTVSQNSLDLDITDVGFGISQVLPVIIQGFLSKANSLTLIEQPEIHLHPKMQADLADLFIDIISVTSKKRPNKFLLIETHSEYLLKRIRRRMAEGVLDPNDVAIYLIDPPDQKNSAIIRELQIQSKGAFEWPKDFYSEELLKDTVEFLKLQN